MLLSSLGKQSDCTVVITGIAKINDNQKWVLSPGGKHIIKLPKKDIYQLKKIENELLIRILDKDQIK